MGDRLLTHRQKRRATLFVVGLDGRGGMGGNVDPVTLIVTALVAGATVALKDVGSNAVKDAYAGLKALVKRAFGGAATATDELEKASPDKAALEQQVRVSGAAEDKAILDKAQELMKLVDPEGTASGKYKVTVTGGIVGNIGDHGTANIGVPPSS